MNYVKSINNFINWCVQIKMNASVANFNAYLRKIQDEYDIDIGPDDNFERVAQELRSLNVEESIVEGQRSLNPPLYQIKLYYPISRGELPMQSMTYATEEPITAADLLNSIAEVYRTSLSSENVQAYINLNSAYENLREPILYIHFMGGPKLRDVISATNLLGLRQYEDGYTLILE